MTQTMLSARLHEYQKPLIVENVKVPNALGEGVVVKVGGAGLCHSDLHLINGEWKNAIPLALPKTPGHEVAGWVEEMGNLVPKGMFERGDLVAVFGGWGCGSCLACKRGDEQMCLIAKWPGLSQHDGGYSQYIAVPSYRFLIKVEGSRLRPEEIAPLTDAGLTPYRAIRRFRHVLVPGTAIAVIGIGGLGSYGIQYAKMLAPNSTTIAVDRSDKKLRFAKNLGAEHAIKLSENTRKEVMEITQGRGVDVVVDCVGAENTISASVALLAKGGALTLVGLFGTKICAPLMSTVINEYQITGSLWGNYNELREVIELAKQGKVKHTIQTFKLEDINNAINLLRNGQITGRAVITPNQ
ncbi:Zn-dependent alcohol dehydrogenase [Candidatus Nitrososphaera evergladensis SR1]|uniref:Zn-dependent alcohol dehydrogenase n=1 Tax=Candidatus Nitrososphaera evergladensis SR1 TaxID=1459636 RepID=A0A075MP80_9ARCH|nr:NAD(P)-dependent alcohol dehydrogenase [Candidatus Nitrososphaera evergladensis]AIF82965.1 Zn-dependent alcohol dehydrogenase [Candidatus Nitrososphaera evergladensis SR1]